MDNLRTKTGSFISEACTPPPDLSHQPFQRVIIRHIPTPSPYGKCRQHYQE